MGEALAGRRRWIWVAAAVVVLALIVYGVVHALSADATEKPKAIATVAVDKGAVTTEVATTGTVQPAQTRSLSFAVKGTVESVSVRAGSTVTAGQALAKVDDTDAAEAVSDAQDSLDDAEDALAEARDNASKTSATTSACGSNVAAAYTSSSPTASPSPSVTVSPSATATASPSATSTRTTSPTKTTAPASTGGTRGGTTGGGTGSCGSSGSSGQQGGQGQSGDAILSAQQRVTQANTTLAEAEEALEGATITAPIAGRIISVSGKVGSQVSAGSAFITLADVYDMQISADFPEADADRLAVKQAGVVTLADRAGTDFKATVVQVDPTGTSDGTMVRYGVLLSFVDAPEDLLVGQSANVKVTTGSKADVLRVPSTAVHDVHGDSGTVLKDGAQVKVGVGLRGDQYTEITSGVAEGDQVARSW
ncbi:efflux RND transporter periplasmic adaptor subunit [Actinoplanes sp. CA-142083]|uniref:efflux RND transporter periplasmic adaptor subunit n=1 Tax=Actinoplanes sp. CA-142083 TaxID=3239903 RepID=UPI003D8DE72F